MNKLNSQEEPDSDDEEIQLTVTSEVILAEQNALLSDLQSIQADFDNSPPNAKRQADLVEQAGSTLAEKLLLS